MDRERVGAQERLEMGWACGRWSSILDVAQDWGVQDFGTVHTQLMLPSGHRLKLDPRSLVF